MFHNYTVSGSMFWSIITFQSCGLIGALEYLFI